jgi:hypothetical protein
MPHDLMFVLPMAKPSQEAQIAEVRAGETFTLTAGDGEPRSRP